MKINPAINIGYVHQYLHGQCRWWVITLKCSKVLGKWVEISVHFQYLYNLCRFLPHSMWKRRKVSCWEMYLQTWLDRCNLWKGCVIFMIEWYLTRIFNVACILLYFTKKQRQFSKAVLLKIVYEHVKSWRTHRARFKNHGYILTL